MGCNYLFLCLIPASGTTLLKYTITKRNEVQQHGSYNLWDGLFELQFIKYIHNEPVSVFSFYDRTCVRENSFVLISSFNLLWPCFKNARSCQSFTLKFYWFRFDETSLRDLCYQFHFFYFPAIATLCNRTVLLKGAWLTVFNAISEH